MDSAARRLLLTAKRTISLQPLQLPTTQDGL